MKLLLQLLLLNILIFKFTSVHAQIDTSFWFAAPFVNPDHIWRDDIKLHISTFSAPTTTVWVRQPSAVFPNRYDTAIIIPAYSTFDYVFWRDKLASPTNIGFDSLETRPANTVLPYGLHISSSSNVTAVYDVITRSPAFTNPETFSLKGRNASGTQFLCPFQTKWINATLVNDINGDGIISKSKQQINVVATQPNTLMWITPKCNVIGHLAGVTYSVLLPDAGSAYTIENAVQSTTVSGQSLSGTAINSNKPICVTVADDSVKGIGGCYDLMGDQIVPLTVIGKEYIVIKGEMYASEPEGAFILASENNTQLIINDGTVTTVTINAGETYHYPTLQPVTYITSDKYVYALHATGMGCELGEALLPPLNCSGSNLVSFSKVIPGVFALNILCKNGAQSTFTLGGSTALVTASAFTIVPGTSMLSGGPYYGAHISFSSSILPMGSYTIGNIDAFALGVFDGNYTSGTTYHYLSSYMNPTDLVVATPGPLCINSTNTVALTGTVTGASSTGVWTTANGTGSLSPVYSSSATVISTTYTLSTADTLQTSLKFYLTSTGNCRPISDSVTMIINHKPGIDISNNITLCKNNLLPVVLSGTVTNALGGLWSGGTGGTYTGVGTSVTYSLSATDVSAAAVIFTLTSQSPMAGCANSEQTLTVNLIDPPTVNSGSDVVICNRTATNVTLYGNISGMTTTGIWTAPGTGTFSPSANSSTVNYLFSGSDHLLTSFIFTLTSINNGLCSDVSDEIQIFRDTSSVTILVSSNTICANQSATLTAVGAPAFLWNTGSISSLIVVAPQLTASYTVQGTTILNCNYTDAVTINVNPLPLITASASNTIICAEEPVILAVTGATNYTWTTIPAFTSSVVVSPTATTIYYVAGTDNNGCKNSDSVSVYISECTGMKGISEEEILLIYPNPTSGKFTIQSKQKMSLRFINQLAQLIKVVELNEENDHRFCVYDLANGIYFITGSVGGKPINRKIVIDK